MADMVYILLSVAFFATVAIVARRVDAWTAPGATVTRNAPSRAADKADLR